MTDSCFNYTPEEISDMNRVDAVRVLAKSGSWLDEQEFPPLRWAVHGLIPEGFGLITGPPKLGKSWFILGVLLAIADGRRAVGRIHVEKRPVLYFALEDSERRMQSRIRHLLGDDKFPAEFRFICDLKNQPVAPLAEAWLDENPNGVVALDTLGKVMPAAQGGEGAYQRDYRVGGQLKALTDDHPGSTLAVVHHVRKQGSADWMDSTSGTNGLNGAADWTLNLERSRNEGQALIRVTGRDVEEGEYAATLKAGKWDLAAGTLAEAAQIARMGAKQEGLGDAAADIVEVVAQYPDGAGAEQVAEELNITPKAAADRLARLAKQERIERIARGRYRLPDSNSTLSTLSTPSQGDDQDEPLFGEYENQQEGA